MHGRLPSAFALLCFLSFRALAAQGEGVPIALSDGSESVVVSVALSSGILGPDDFPVAGRDCDSFLSELRRNESFAGQIRASYEPPADSGRCFNLEGKSARVAVVCCAPRSRP